MAELPQLNSMNKKIEIKGIEITIYQTNNEDYISLTDIARHKDSGNMDLIIQNWLRNRNTIELLGFWKILYNPNFKPLEFDGFRKQAGLKNFVLKAKKWIETIHAKGITSTAGRYGGAFANKDIDFEFVSLKNKLFNYRKLVVIKGSVYGNIKINSGDKN